MRAVEILMTVLGPSLQRVLFIYLAEISAHYIYTSVAMLQDQVSSNSKALNYISLF